MDNSGGFTPAPPPPPPPPEGGGGGGGAGGGFTPKTLGDVLSTAFDLYKANAATFLQIVAIVVIPLTFVQYLLTDVAFKNTASLTINQETGEISGGSSFGRGILILIVAGVIGYLIQYLVTGAITRSAAGSLVGMKIDVGESYRYAFKRLAGLILVAILIALAVGVGLILLIIPGLIFAVFFSVAIPAFVIEHRKGTEALSRSWNLVRGSFWHVLGVIFVAGLLAAVVSGILGAIGGTSFFLSWIFGAIAQIIVSPFVALVGVVLYVDLRARHENLTPDGLRGELSSSGV